MEKLLILQDRDRKIHRVQEELAQIAPERESLRNLTAATQTQLAAAKTRVKQNESERKQLELEVQAKQAQIARYAIEAGNWKVVEPYLAAMTVNV